MEGTEEDVPKTGGEITWGKYLGGMVWERKSQKIESSRKREFGWKNLYGEIPQEEEKDDDS